MGRRWPVIIAEAARIATSYSTPVTLRQLHYRLVAAGTGGYLNTQSCYKQLSALTAEARRAEAFPELSDRTRGVERPGYYDSPHDAMDALIDWYRRDRTEGQAMQVWVLYEKATLGAQIEAWTEQYGLPTAALRGYSSESLEREIFLAMTRDGRPVVVFYLGDLDPEGEDIERNFRAQATRQGVTFKHWQRLTVRPTQIGPLGLVPNPGKSTSSRAPGFIAKYGRLFQIEVEAVDPAVLEQFVYDAINDPVWFDVDAFDRAKVQEADDIEWLERMKKARKPK
jgi:hypothetical protein